MRHFIASLWYIQGKRDAYIKILLQGVAFIAYSIFDLLLFIFGDNREKLEAFIQASGEPIAFDMKGVVVGTVLHIVLACIMIKVRSRVISVLLTVILCQNVIMQAVVYAAFFQMILCVILSFIMIVGTRAAFHIHRLYGTKILWENVVSKTLLSLGYLLLTMALMGLTGFDLEADRSYDAAMNVAFFIVIYLVLNEYLPFTHNKPLIRFPEEEE